ncbi:MAG TPA: hypothetical protein VFP50_10290 [Anaeromyxobacteraceae bacterium]|nr:hypothetical protein [Anaeromyxobacteraceae bacterium]
MPAGVAPSGAEISVRLAEAFTPLEAHVLHDLVERAPPGTLVDLDFHAVRTCHDVALLLLSRDLRSGRARFAIHGMSHHQSRVLDYLGTAGTGEAAGA